MADEGSGKPEKDRSYRGQADASLRRAHKAMKSGEAGDRATAETYLKQAQVLATLALSESLDGQSGTAGRRLP